MCHPNHRRQKVTQIPYERRCNRKVCSNLVPTPLSTQMKSSSAANIPNQLKVHFAALPPHAPLSPFQSSSSPDTAHLQQTVCSSPPMDPRTPINPPLHVVALPARNCSPPAARCARIRRIAAACLVLQPLRPPPPQQPLPRFYRFCPASTTASALNHEGMEALGPPRSRLLGTYRR